jgi:hypothetical protein
LRRPAATDRIGVRNTPEMNVNASSATTPHALSRRRVTTNSDASIAPNIRAAS